MKRLIFVRHAKSSWKNPDLEDIDRPLNKRGMKDAPDMGLRLKKKKINPELLITSPANRAQTTARIIAEKIDYPAKKIETQASLYSSGVPGIMNVITHIDDVYSEVMLFGHNPDFTTITNYLSSPFTDKLPTCGVVAIDFDVMSWMDVR